MDAAALLEPPELRKLPTSRYGNQKAILMVLIAALGPLGFGLTLGFTSPSQLPMEVGPKDHWAYSAVFDAKVSGEGASATIASTQAPIFGSLVNVGCMVGALIAGPLADMAGRKLALCGAALPWIGAWAIIGFGDSFAVLLVGRLLCGVAVGITSMTVPLYITEVSPTSMRGALGAVNQLAVTIGIFGVNLLGELMQTELPTSVPCGDGSGAASALMAEADDGACDVVSGTCDDGLCHTQLAPWRVLALIAGGCASALLLCALLLLPETPAFLVTKGKASAARATLARLRSSETEAQEEMDALLRLQQAASSTNAVEGQHHEVLGGFASDEPPPLPGARRGGVRGLFVPGVRAPFAIGCTLMFAQQFSGINAVIFYTAEIAKSSGIDPNLGALITMAVQVVMTIVAVLLVDRAGRRVLLLVSIGGMCICSGALGGFAQAGAALPPVLGLVALIGYIVFFSLGLGAIPWLIMGEIFPSHVRAVACSLATLINWFFSFVMTLIFAQLKGALGIDGVFYLFAGVCGFSWLFVLAFVPETKGKSIEEVEALFR